MSYAVSWIAVRGKRPEEVRRVLGLQASGVWHEEPNYPIAAARLATGWYLVRTEGLTSMLCEPGVASQLSEDCEVVTCCLNEDDYLSAAEQWENGKRLWGIRYYRKHGRRSVEVDGALPLGFDSIKVELLEKEKADADVFYEMPIDVAEAVTGYRDDVLPVNVLGQRYELLIARRGGEVSGMGR